jgi:epsin
VLAGGDDDFADFQAAPSSPPAATTNLAAAPVTGTSKPNLMDLLASTAPSASSRSVQSVQPQPFGAFNAALVPPSSQQLRPSSTPATAPAYTGMPVMSPMSARSAATSPVATGTTSSAAAGSTKLGGGFDDLWSMSLGSTTASNPGGGAAAGAKSIRDLEKEKAQAGIWGVQSQVRPAAPASVPAGGFGSFAKPLAPSGGGDLAGADDLLL